MTTILIVIVSASAGALIAVVAVGLAFIRGKWWW